MRNDLILLSAITSIIFMGCDKKATDSTDANSQLKSCIVGTWSGTAANQAIQGIFNSDGTYTSTVSSTSHYTYIEGTWEISNGLVISVITKEGSSTASLETATSSAQAIAPDEQTKSEGDIYCANNKLGSTWIGGNSTDLTGTWQPRNTSKTYRKKDGVYTLESTFSETLTLNQNNTGEDTYSSTRYFYSGAWQSTPLDDTYPFQICAWSFSNGTTLTIKKPNSTNTACTGSETDQVFDVTIDGTQLIFPVLTKQ